MIKDIQQIPSGPRQVRNGIFVIACFSVIVDILIFKSQALLIVGSIAFLLAILALLAPAVMRPVYMAWMILALCIGRVMNPVILGLVYFVVLTPIALILRLTGKDLLSRKFQDVPTYWQKREAKTSDQATYERQF